ncbi:MAG TPA: DUF4908 domain-containing protein [Caulobacteraceae bacterium]|jgi:hypothetical protein
MTGRSTVVAAALALVASGWCAPALAQSNAAGLTGRPGAVANAAPPVAKYVAGDDREFTLDRTGPRPLLKFEDDPEVLVLYPSPGPRGDVIYRDDTGRPVVRATRLGGLTVFTPDRPGGLPAALAGQTTRIRMAAISAVQLLRHIARQSLRASQAVGRRVVFEAPEIRRGEETVYAEAATLTAEAFEEASRRERTQRALRNVRRVELTTGQRPDVALAGDTVRVTVTPQYGHAGRPSSRRILSRIGGR